jgi:inner membrane protein
LRRCVDNLCQTRVGGALARAGLHRTTPRAAATLMLAANLPDVDAITVFTGGATGFRRGITHGLPALVLLPLLLAGLVLLWDRWRTAEGRPRARAGWIVALAWLGALTHPVLDWLNVYGMRWLMPLDGRWFYGDSLFIMDPWLWGMLGIGWLLRREGVARLTLGMAAAYVAGMVTLTGVARRVAARDLGLAGPGPRVLQVAPPFGASWRREVIVDAGDRYRFGHVGWRPRPRLVLYEGGQPKDLDAVAARGDDLPPEVVAFLDWARFPFAEAASWGGEPAVRLDDIRYAGARPSFAAVYLPATGPVRPAPQPASATAPRGPPGPGPDSPGPMPAAPPAAVAPGGQDQP